MTTVLATYAAAAATTHTIPLDTLVEPTAGRSIVVLAHAAAGFPTAPAGWVRDDYTVNLTAGAVYRLPPAANDGTIRELALTLSGSRALSAVVVEDDIDATSAFVSFAHVGSGTRTVLPTPSVTTGAVLDVVLAVVGATNAGGTAVPAPTAWSNDFVAAADSGSVATSGESARVMVARDTDRGLGAEETQVTLTAATTGPYVAGFYGYDTTAPPVQVDTTRVTADLTDPSLTAGLALGLDVDLDAPGLSAAIQEGAAP